MIAILMDLLSTFFYMIWCIFLVVASCSIIGISIVGIVTLNDQGCFDWLKKLLAPLFRPFLFVCKKLFDVFVYIDDKCKEFESSVWCARFVLLMMFLTFFGFFFAFTHPNFKGFSHYNDPAAIKQEVK